MVMKRSVVCVVLIILGCGIAVGVWYARQQNTFMFTVDMPPGFKYKADVHYVPAPGETCTVTDKDSRLPTFKETLKKTFRSGEIRLSRELSG